MSHIELDIALDCPKSYLDETIAKHGLTHTLVKAHGPAGGNPVYRLDGPRENIVAWLDDTDYAQDPIGLAFYSSLIEN